MIEQRIFIPTKTHDIPMVITYPNLDGVYPCMLLLHGFLAYKEGDGYLFTKTAQALANNGIASARIDFCSMGENRYSRKFYGTKICIEETKEAFNYLCSCDHIDSSRIGLLGHSMGARIALLCSDLDSKCIVTFNGAVNVEEPYAFDILSNQNKEELKTQGYTFMYPSDGRVELLFNQFYLDCEIHSSEIYNYHRPILVCVGKQDPTLNPKISYRFARKHPYADLLEIDGANHTFNAKTKDYTKVDELLEKVVSWLKINL